MFNYTLGAALDYESGEIQLLTITAMDSGKLNITTSFNVTVLDVNEKPFALSLSNYQVSQTKNNKHYLDNGILTLLMICK